MKLFKRSISYFLCLFLFFSSCAVMAQPELPAMDATSYLLMEASTGEILAAHNESEPRAIASITKLMTVLLILEELQSGNLSLTDQVTAGINASEMGGSQIYLKENEVMDVDTLLKSIFVASANDSCVAMAEHISGSEAAFVERMNQRAQELGLTQTSYKNVHGLDEEGHYSTATDVANLAREVLKHEIVKNYTGIWQEKIRNDTFELTNTNKLIRFYDGATGLKTGSTTNAGCCLCATAKRNQMELISVTLNSPTDATRFSDGKKLLDYGFANYNLTPLAKTTEIFAQANIRYAKEDTVNLYPKEDLNLLTKKSDTAETVSRVELTPVKAPLAKGSVCGKLIFEANGEIVKETELVLTEDVAKQSWLDTLKDFLKVI